MKFLGPYGFKSNVSPAYLFVFLGLNVLQRIGSIQEGNASFSLSGDYYNRELAGTTLDLLLLNTFFTL